MQSIAEICCIRVQPSVRRTPMDARQFLHAILKFRRDSIFISPTEEVGDIARCLARIYVSFDELVNNSLALSLRARLIDSIDVTANEWASMIIILNLYFYFLLRAILIIKKKTALYTGKVAHIDNSLVWKTYSCTHKHVTYARTYARVYLGARSACERHAHAYKDTRTVYLRGGHAHCSPCCVRRDVACMYGHAWIHACHHSSCAQYTNCSRGLTRSATAVSRKEEGTLLL